MTILCSIMWVPIPMSYALPLLTLPPIISIDAQEKIEMIRRRETLDDIFSTYTF